MIREESGLPLEYHGCSKEENIAKLAEIGVPQFIDGDFSKSPIPFCSEDIVSTETSVLSGRFLKDHSDIELLTGQKPQSVRDVVKKHAYMWEQNILNYAGVK